MTYEAAPEKVRLTVFPSADEVRTKFGVEPISFDTEITPDGGLCDDSLDMVGTSRPFSFDRTNGAEVWTTKIYMRPEDLEVFLKSRAD